MDRRTFMSAAGAAGSLLVTGLIPRQVQPQDLLRLWTANDPNARYDLTQPWTYSRNAYASDSYAMARIACLDSDVDCSTRRLPENIFSTWDYHWRDGPGWMPLPNVLDTIPYNDCYCWSCARTDCPDCDGIGHVYHPSTYNGLVDCDTCRGHGYLRRGDCRYCHGRDRPVPFVAVLGGSAIQLRYVERLRETVPGVRWRSTGPDKPIVWRSDVGIAGIVMAIPRDSLPLSNCRRWRLAL